MLLVKIGCAFATVCQTSYHEVKGLTVCFDSGFARGDPDFDVIWSPL